MQSKDVKNEQLLTVRVTRTARHSHHKNIYCRLK